MSKWCIREAVKGDLAFVTDSWLESFRKSHAAGPIPSDMYRPLYREIIKRVLGREGIKLLVAFNPEDEDQIYGWACTEPGPVLHFVFVKSAFRRWGIATNLVQASGIDPKQPFTLTFKSPGTSKLSSWAIRFNPLYIRRPEKENEDP